MARAKIYRSVDRAEHAHVWVPGNQSYKKRIDTALVAHESLAFYWPISYLKCKIKIYLASKQGLRRLRQGRQLADRQRCDGGRRLIKWHEKIPGMKENRRHRFHGDPKRFEVIASYIEARFGSTVRYLADVAGGQGMLSRILCKKFNYDSEVVDPRGWTLKGVPNRPVEFDASMADYYDLIIGLHADEATRPVAQAALYRPVILVPCCNFWSEEKLGRDELLDAIEEYYRCHKVSFERVEFAFKGPKNIGIVSEPPNVPEPN